MGGRGSSSGISANGKEYGTEYSTVYQSGNIKFVVSNSGSAKNPIETMTKGRVYAAVNANNEVKSISYYDSSNKRTKTIDLGHYHNKIKPHTHHGYLHNENDSPKGAAKLTTKERKMVERILKLWYNYKSK